MPKINIGDILVSDLDNLRYKVIDIGEASFAPSEKHYYLQLQGRFRFLWPFGQPSLTSSFREKFVFKHFQAVRE